MDMRILEQAGFTKGEIRIYLALLELGETTTGPIIDKSKISSSKVYEILNKLIGKGLVSYTIKDKIKYFQPASPDKITDYLNKKRIEFEKTANEVGIIIPLLKKKQKLSESTQTTSVYEGFEGIKTATNRILEILNKGDEYYVFTVDEEISSEKLKLFLQNYHAKRIAKGIKVKLLSNKKYEKEIKKTYPKYKFSERKFVNRAFPTGVFIFKNHVMHFIYKPRPTLFVIKSSQNYESYKKFFLELWGDAKK